MLCPVKMGCFNGTQLRLRCLSVALIAPVILLAVFLGSVVYGALVVAAATFGTYEWLRLVAPQTRPRTVGFACVFVAATLIAATLGSMDIGLSTGCFSAFFLYILARREGEEKPGWIVSSFPYMGGFGLALLFLRETPDIGMGVTFYLLLTVWAIDIGAFFVGRGIGGPRLAPAISPNKTWAGLVGGIGGAALVGFYVASFLGAKHPCVTLLFAPVLGVVAQAGDLFESFFKRQAGVKESGDVIPGHGGVLDRVDGLIFAAVCAALVQGAVPSLILWFWKG